MFLTKRTQRVSLGGCFIKSVFCEIRSPSRHGFRAITVPDLHISYITSASPLKKSNLDATYVLNIIMF